MDEKDIINKMDEVKRLVTEIAAGAGGYMQMYEELLRAVEKKYGARDAAILRQVSLMSSIVRAKKRVERVINEEMEVDED